MCSGRDLNRVSDFLLRDPIDLAVQREATMLFRSTQTLVIATCSKKGLRRMAGLHHRSPSHFSIVAILTYPFRITFFAASLMSAPLTVCLPACSEPQAPALLFEKRFLLWRGVAPQRLRRSLFQPQIS